MSYDATVLKVMIASPGDVPQERQLARAAIQEWNDVHAEDRGIVLMSVGWDTHATPEMGDRAQAIINSQVLAGCDLLVAIFWTRLGSPTGAAASGTVEEIEEFLATGKPVMIYFSSAPVRLDSVDGDQYAALRDFKGWCRQRGIVEEYDGVAEFRDKFDLQLAQMIIRQFTNETPATAVAHRPQRQHIQLSESARELLVQAVKDATGVIMRLETFDGTNVQTNGLEFVDSGDARTAAKWRGAVDELHDARLIEDRGGKGELFFVTNRGYELAESVAVSAAPQQADRADG